MIGNSEINVNVQNQSKKQSCPHTRHEGEKEKTNYNSYSFLTSALVEVSGQHHALAALYPRQRTPDTPG
jgi:hypothetical protein